MPSNVVKIARAVKTQYAPNPPSQLLYYDRGVGTGNFIDRVVGGLTGSGISRNILQAFRWIVECYEPCDRLYFFGFSRGAYSVRSLAGLLGVCGIPKRPLETDNIQTMLNEALKTYRTTNSKHRERRSEAFRKSYKARRCEIYFIGVWDTVGALGVPTAGPIGQWTRRRSGFHDVSLGSHIRHAYHAIAINERRGPFKPTLWKQVEERSNQTLVQAWFPGVHTNIGGGYVDSGLSDRALLWMIYCARQHELDLDEGYLDLFLRPNWFGELRDSINWPYRLMFWNRPRERTIGITSPGSEFLHRAASGRWCDKTRPDEEPPNFTKAVKRNVQKLRADEWEINFNLSNRTPN